jgi:predicted dehydrogenase
MIFYRMNAGHLEKEEILQRTMGAGRLIGEACHIFDVFLYLVEAEPISVSVESLKPKTPYLFPTDNFSAQISFVDGSICTLIYTSLGNPSMGKERLEVYFDGKSIVMDDYISLEGYGLPMAFNEYVKYPNTGQATLINKFVKAVQKTPYEPPLELSRLYQATELTLVIDELALRGGGEKNL